MTKTEAVLRHLQENKSINTWEAIQEYGATRLSAIIYNLRHKYELYIVNENVNFVDRYGNKAHYVNYCLKEK